MRGQSRRLTLKNPMVLTALVLFGIFGILWVELIIPDFLEQSFFASLNPVAAYLIYNIGALSLTTAFFGFFLGSFLLKQRFNLINALKLGLVSFLLFSFLWDMWEPPLYLSPQGHVLIPLGTIALENTAVDAMTAYVWTTLIPSVANTSALFALVYFVTPVMALIASAFLLSPRVFVRLITSGGR